MSLILFTASLMALGAQALAAEKKVGSCAAADNDVIRRYDFYVESEDGYRSLSIRGAYGENDPRTFKLYSFALTPQTIQEDSAYALRIKSGKEALSINRKSGEGSYKYSGWETKCAPGGSEWCVIKIPTFVRTTNLFRNCQINF